jgi:tetratricopeptide (TPR) repeat protein
MLRVSGSAGNKNAEKLRAEAEDEANKALSLANDDPLALEVLRMLQDDKLPPLHQPTAEATAEMSAGEVLFQSKKYDEALPKYEHAAKLDPLSSQPWVYAGDCFYRQKKWSEAQARYRKATAIEPSNGTAWQFLADALESDDKHDEAVAALIQGIAAQPNQLPTWEKLARTQTRSGKKMTALHLVRKAKTIIDPSNGHINVVINPIYSTDGGKFANTPDAAVWLAYAMMESDLKTEAASGKVKRSEYEIEVEAWRKAMKVAGESTSKSGEPLKDPALKSLQTLAQANQLEPAVLLLMYKESYRDELEAWKKANPNGIKHFVESYEIRP